MKRSFLLAALVPIAACDAILGIEPPPLQDASTDGSPLDVMTDGGAKDATGDGPTLGFCESAANGGTVYFCDDFDSDAGATGKWDDASVHEAGSFAQSGTTDAGSPPYVLFVDAPAGSTASLKKHIVLTGGSAKITFSARVPCAANTFVAITAPPHGGFFNFSSDGTSLRISDISVPFGPSMSCTPNWHTFMLQLLPNEISMSIDNTGPLTEANDAGFTDLTIQLGAINVIPGGGQEYFDNVLVTP